jgi:hypothetical protein
MHELSRRSPARSGAFYLSSAERRSSSGVDVQNRHPDAAWRTRYQNLRSSSTKMYNAGRLQRRAPRPCPVQLRGDALRRDALFRHGIQRPEVGDGEFVALL